MGATADLTLYLTLKANPSAVVGLLQVLQQDIESHSRIVSAVLKLSERLEHVRTSSCTSSSDCESLQLVALNLERRWHGIWLQSLEWQCRLEEAINRRKVSGNFYYFTYCTCLTDALFPA